MYYDTKYNRPVAELPPSLVVDGRINFAPSAAQYAERFVPVVPDQDGPASDERYTHSTFDVRDGKAYEYKHFEPIPSPPPPPLDVLQVAAGFRDTLRKHFGDGAERDRIVTRPAVAAFFDGKRKAGKLTVALLGDAMALDQAFQQLAAFTGSGETWSFFDEYGELLGGGE